MAFRSPGWLAPWRADWHLPWRLAKWVGLARVGCGVVSLEGAFSASSMDAHGSGAGVAASAAAPCC